MITSPCTNCGKYKDGWLTIIIAEKFKPKERGI
jgi:hypothetical protein